LAPPPAGYAVSNHCVKNRLRRVSQALVFTGKKRRKPASSCGSVMLDPP